jgi:hypothetical protein
VRAEHWDVLWGGGLLGDHQIGITERGQRARRDVASQLRVPPNLSSHRLGSQAEYAHECPPHSFAIRKAGLKRLPRLRFIASMGPRDNRAVGFMSATSAAPTRPRVRSLRMRWMVTISDLRSPCRRLSDIRKGQPWTPIGSQMARPFTATPRWGPLARVPPASDAAIGARIKLDASSTRGGPTEARRLGCYFSSSSQPSIALRERPWSGPASPSGETSR